MSGQEISRDFLEDYEDAADDVRAAKWDAVGPPIEEWLNVVRGFEPAQPLLSKITNPGGFDEWYEDQSNSGGGMAGSANLRWPSDRLQRVAYQMELYRKFSVNEIRISDFGIHFGAGLDVRDI